jgi:hypothetical protein
MSEHDDLHEPTPEDLELQRAVRERLRSEPVEIDPARREAAISAALDAAATPEEADAPAARVGAAPLGSAAPRDRAARRSPGALRPILVAAAAVTVIAGGVAAVGQLGSDSSEDAAVEAESAHEGGSLMEGAGAGGAATDADSEQSSADAPASAAPTTTATALSGAGADRATAPDLGDFEDVDALLQTAATTLDDAGSFDGSSRQEGLTDAEAELRARAASAGLPCAEEAVGLGAVPVALARVQASPVVVVQTAAGTLLALDAASCDELAR